MSKKRIKKASAISYNREQGDSAPKVIASGVGKLAEKIIELAQKNGIPIKEDESLADALSKVDIGSEIPEELFVAVAEILAFVYKHNR
jgi:flagellar biosynthesis protein